MSGKERRLPDYLGHALQAVGRIMEYTKGLSEAAFLGSPLVQDAVVRNFEILGEACRNIVRDHPEFAAAHPELPLDSAWEMRNALAHGYFHVDLRIVWRTLRDDLPDLREKIQALAQGAGTTAND